MDYTLSYNGASLAEHCTQPYLAKLQALQSTLGDNLQASCENLLPDVDVTVTVDSIVPGTIIAVLGYVSIIYCKIQDARCVAIDKLYICC